SGDERLKISTVPNPIGGNRLTCHCACFCSQARPNTLSRFVNQRRSDWLVSNFVGSFVEDCVKIIIAFHDVSPESAQSLFLVLSWRDATRHLQPSVKCRAASRSPDCRILRSNAARTFRLLFFPNLRPPGESAVAVHDQHVQPRGFAICFRVPQFLHRLAPPISSG